MKSQTTARLRIAAREIAWNFCVSKRQAYAITPTLLPAARRRWSDVEEHLKGAWVVDGEATEGPDEADD